MEPRLSTSRKWSPLPAELVTQIQQVFKQNFSKEIGDSTVESKGHIYPEEILISVGIRSKNQLKARNWMVSIGYSLKKDNVLKLLHLAVDTVAALFEQTFQNETDHDFPRTWDKVDFEGRPVFVQYSTVNSELESEADKLLGKDFDPDAVAQGDWDEDFDPETIKATLGLDDDDDELPTDDEPTPKKSGKKLKH